MEPCDSGIFDNRNGVLTCTDDPDEAPEGGGPRAGGGPGDGGGPRAGGGPGTGLSYEDAETDAAAEGWGDGYRVQGAGYMDAAGGRGERPIGEGPYSEGRHTEERHKRIQV